MYNSIILSSSIFGSIILFSTSLVLINNSLLENKPIPKKVHLINGLTFIISGSILIHSFSWTHFNLNSQLKN
jgi:hypothetical protein